MKALFAVLLFASTLLQGRAAEFAVFDVFLDTNGEPLVKGRQVTGFTNTEEEAVQLTNVVPFLLEDKLKSIGGIYEKSGLWQEHVVVDQRLVAGQNPQSARAVGNAVAEALRSL